MAYIHVKENYAIYLSFPTSAIEWENKSNSCTNKHTNKQTNKQTDIKTNKHTVVLWGFNHVNPDKIQMIICMLRPRIESKHNKSTTNK